MDYKITRIGNIVLGLACVGIETFVYNWSYNTALADQIYLGVVSFFTLEALIALLVYRNKAENTWETVWRILCSCTLMGVGTWLIVSALDIEDHICLGNTVVVDEKRCHHFESKLATAALAILNGILYLFAKPKKASNNGIIYPGLPPAPKGTILTDDSQLIYTMPRVHLMNQPYQKQSQGMDYNYSNNNTGPGSQYSQSQQYPATMQPVQASNPQPGWSYAQPNPRY